MRQLRGAGQCLPAPLCGDCVAFPGVPAAGASLNMPVPLPGQRVPEQGHAQALHCTLEFSDKLIIAYF